MDFLTIYYMDFPTIYYMVNLDNLLYGFPNNLLYGES